MTRPLQKISVRVAVVFRGRETGRVKKPLLTVWKIEQSGNCKTPKIYVIQDDEGGRHVLRRLLKTPVLTFWSDKANKKFSSRCVFTEAKACLRKTCCARRHPFKVQMEFCNYQ